MNNFPNTPEDCAAALAQALIDTGEAVREATTHGVEATKHRDRQNHAAALDELRRALDCIERGANRAATAACLARFIGDDDSMALAAQAVDSAAKNAGACATAMIRAQSMAITEAASRAARRFIEGGDDTAGD